MTFGEALRHVRKKERYSQVALGAVTGIDRTYINKIERGKVEPGKWTRELLVRALP